MIWRILCIDGGGILGLIPALILAEIEARTGVLAGRLFDLVAGTSTGGIIASAAAAGIPAEDVAELYRQRGKDIFSKNLWHRLATGFGLWGPQYGAKGIESALAGVFGEVLGDVFGKGLAFDSMAGDFRLADGMATTNNFKIHSPAAEIRITGRTDLRARRFDQQIVVISRDTNSGTFETFKELVLGKDAKIIGSAEYESSTPTGMTAVACEIFWWSKKSSGNWSIAVTALIFSMNAGANSNRRARRSI